MTSVNPLNPRERSPLAIWLLAAVTLAVYAPVCRQDFVVWDDPVHVLQNPWFHPVTVAHLRHFWVSPYEGMYIPLSYLLYGLLTGMATATVVTPTGPMTVIDPHLFHAANLILHTLNVMLAFFLFRRFVRRDWAAFGGALLFAVHPVQVETVAWVSEMRGLLSAFFALLALGQFLNFLQGAQDQDKRRRGHYGAYLLLLAAALLAKPTAVAVPLLAFVLDWGLVRKNGRAAALALRGGLALIGPFWLLTRDAQPIPSALHIPFGSRLCVAGDALAFYLGKIVWPLRLGIDYRRTPIQVLSHSWGHLTWLVPLTLAVIVGVIRRRYPWAIVCAGLFLAGVLPVLGLVPFAFQGYSTVADRYLYLAMLGPALGVAFLLDCVSVLALRRVALAGVGLACAWMFLSRAQVRTWNNSETLFRHAIAVNPNSPPMHNNLGCLLLDERSPEAASQFVAAIRLEPNFAEARSNLGLALEQAGQPDAARAEYEQTLRIDPDFAKAEFLLGRLLFREGHTAEGQAHLNRAVSLDPSLSSVLSALGPHGRIRYNGGV